jgi:hypothetical protein
MVTHRPEMPLSSVLRRDGAVRRDPCGANLDALWAAPLWLWKFGSDGVEAVVGGNGSGFTVMLDLPLSVLEPVMELKREVSSARGIVTACKAATRAVPNKATLSVGECHSTLVSGGRRRCYQVISYSLIPRCWW